MDELGSGAGGVVGGGVFLGGSLSRPAPDRRSAVGEHGSAYGNFTRAIEVGNVVAAELAARELGSLRLVDALEFVALVARKGPNRSRRMAASWLERWLTETNADDR